MALTVFLVRPQMTGDFLDGRDHANLEHIANQPIEHLQVGIEEIELFDEGLPAEWTEYFSALTADPDANRSEVQIADPPLEMPDF